MLNAVRLLTLIARLLRVFYHNARMRLLNTWVLTGLVQLTFLYKI